MPFSLLMSAFCSSKVYPSFLPQVLRVSRSVFHLPCYDYKCSLSSTTFFYHLVSLHFGLLCDSPDWIGSCEVLNQHDALVPDSVSGQQWVPARSKGRGVPAEMGGV